MALPEPCEKCAPFGGNWKLLRCGTARCDCERGRALAAMDCAKSQPIVRDVEPRISDETATACVSMLSSIPYFPAEPAARMLIADEFQSLCENDLQAFWLAKRFVQLFARWPGVPALRMVFCARYIPLDRAQPIGICEAYPEGIPLEIEQPTPIRRALPPGHVASADPELDAAVQGLAKVKRLG